MVALARSDASAAALQGAGAGVHRGSLDDVDALRAGAGAADGVIHLAFKHQEAFSGDFATATDADRAAVQAVVGSDRPLLIASGVAGPEPGKLATEDDVPDAASPVGARSLSERSALALAERGVRSVRWLARLFGLDVLASSTAHSSSSAGDPRTRASSRTSTWTTTPGRCRARERSGRRGRVSPSMHVACFGPPDRRGGAPMGHLLHLADVPETRTTSGRWQPLNERLGITNFGISAVVVEPGEDPDIEHDEGDSGHQEAYVVVSGRAAFRLGDEQVEAGPGDVVAVPDTHETRGYRALEPGTRIICLGAGPGAEHPYGRWIAEEAAE